MSEPLRQKIFVILIYQLLCNSNLFMSPLFLDLRQAWWFALVFKYIHCQHSFVGIRYVLFLTPDLNWSRKIYCLTYM